MKLRIMCFFFLILFTPFPSLPIFLPATFPHHFFSLPPSLSLSLSFLSYFLSLIFSRTLQSGGSYTCKRASDVLVSVTNMTCLEQPYWTKVLNTPIYYNSTQKDPACINSSSCWNILDYVPNTGCSIGVCDASATCVAQTIVVANSPW